MLTIKTATHSREPVQMRGDSLHSSRLRTWRQKFDCCYEYQLSDLAAIYTGI